MKRMTIGQILTSFLDGFRKMQDSRYLEYCEISKSARQNQEMTRTDIINATINALHGPACRYLEIGVRRPADNFDKINARCKISVDPGIEESVNSATHKMTSDAFFKALRNGTLHDSPDKFDCIFIDGLHTAEQCDRDIKNSLEFLTEKGVILIHDCNPPTEWHTRDDFQYRHTPAGGCWNGTTWKSFVKARARGNLFSCCVDTDWGIGVLSSAYEFGTNFSGEIDEFYDYRWLTTNRSEILNLISPDQYLNVLKTFSTDSTN